MANYPYPPVAGYGYSNAAPSFSQSQPQNSQAGGGALGSPYTSSNDGMIQHAASAFQQNAAVPPSAFQPVASSPQLNSLWSQFQVGGLPPPPHPSQLLALSGARPPFWPPAPLQPGVTDTISTQSVPSYPVPPQIQEQLKPDLPKEMPMQKPLPPRRLAVQGESDMEEGELLSDSGHRAFSIAKTTNGHRAGQPGHDDSKRPSEIHTRADSRASLRRGQMHEAALPSDASGHLGWLTFSGAQDGNEDAREGGYTSGASFNGIAASSTPIQVLQRSQNTLPPKPIPRSNASPINKRGTGLYRKHNGNLSGSHMAEKREQAKRFLALMHAHSYKLPELVQEGLDVEILRDLYRELGISGNHSAHASSPSVSARQAQPPQHPIRTKTPAAADVTNRRLSPPSSRISETALGASASGASSINQVVPRSEPAVGAPSASKPYSETQGKMGQSTSNVPVPPARTEGKGDQKLSSEASNPPLERKDYIARLLAAKSGKVSTAPKASTITQPSPAIKPAAPTAQFEIPQISDISCSKSSIVSPDHSKPVRADKLASDPTSLADKTPKNTASTDLNRDNSPQQPQIASKAVSDAISGVQSSPAHRSMPFTTSQSQSPKAELKQSSELHKPEQIATKDPPSNLVVNSSTSTNGGRTLDSAIPGLFMAGAGIKDEGEAREKVPIKGDIPADVSIPKGKKRPVASDFEEPETSYFSKPHKRPFVHNRFDPEDEEMIIEVSEDETADSLMDVDEVEPAPEPTVPNHSTPGQLMLRKGSLRDMPSLPDYSSQAISRRQTGSMPSSVLNTPPASQTPRSGSVADPVRKAEEEILALKRKIAEFERRRKMKVEASSAQAPSTRAVTPSNAPRMIDAQSTNEISRCDASAPLLTMSIEENNTTRATSPAQAPSNPAKPDATDTEKSKAHEEAAALLNEQKRRRRAEIESGLPALDASFATTQARLADLREEMERLEAENHKRLKDKETLIKELEALGTETEGLSHAELQAKRDEIAREEVAKPPSPVNKGTSPGPTGTFEAHTTNSELVFNSPRFQATPSEPRVEEILPDSAPDLDDSARVLPPDSDKSTAASEPAAEDIDYGDNASASGSAGSRLGAEQNEVSDFMEDAMDTSEGDSETKLPVADDRQNQHDRDVTSTYPINDATIATLSSPCESNAASEEMQLYTTEQSSVSTHAGSVADTGAGSQSAGAMDIASVNPTNILAHATHQLSEQASPDDERIDEISFPIESSEAQDMEEFEAVVGADIDDEIPDSMQQREYLGRPQSVSVPPIDSNANDSRSASPANNLGAVVHEVTGEENRPSDTVSGRLMAPDETKVATSAHFSPYESPLKLFKAYRYHPQFVHDVAGGYRSMTYSHNIDPSKPLCQFEAAGGTCNDSQCEGQHFKAMNLSDDMILVRLGTSNPGRTPAEEQQWKEGLKLVLKDLRQKNTKDLDVVATEIASYRRRFLKDPSKILTL